MVVFFFPSCHFYSPLFGHISVSCYANIILMNSIIYKLRPFPHFLKCPLLRSAQFTFLLLNLNGPIITPQIFSVYLVLHLVFKVFISQDSETYIVLTDQRVQLWLKTRFLFQARRTKGSQRNHYNSLSLGTFLNVTVKHFFPPMWWLVSSLRSKTVHLSLLYS
jgi:hypothetical protein